jgi:hypothetical protein
MRVHFKSVHDKIKDFKCPIEGCFSSFSSNTGLNAHKYQKHTNDQNFKCSHCDQKFKMKGNLVQHIKSIHIKLKDFECPNKDCDYACSRNGDLQVHIKRCTGKINCSSGEFAIMKTLDEMNIEYKYNQSHELKSDKGWLRWDFIVEVEDDRLFIEYDGIQHFKPVKFGSMPQEKANKSFKRQQENDKLKNDYCKKNDYKLLRIPYTKFPNVHQIVSKFIMDNTDWDSDEKL